MRKVLGIEGAKGSGKDTVCKLILNSCPLETRRFAFADALKDELHEEMGLDLAIMHGSTEEKDTIHTGYDWDHNRFDQFRTNGQTGRITYREMLTIWGQMKGTGYWVDKVLVQLYTWLDKHEDGLAIITDVRMPLEAKTIQNLSGILLKVDGEEQGEFNDHPTESHSLPFDYEVKGRGKSSIGQTKSSLIEVMWSAFGINMKGRV